MTTAPAPPVAPPFVGRSQELGLLDDLLERAERFAAPQLVTIVGTPGVGKSRLVETWSARLAERPEPPRVLVAAARRGDPPRALIERLLRRRFQLGPDEGAESASPKVRLELEQLFGDPRVADLIHFLGRFLPLRERETPTVRALADAPDHHDTIARTVVRRVFEIDAAARPLVLVLDDLHEADDASLDLLEELVRGLGGSSVVVVAAARHELLVRRPRWGTGTDHTRLDLPPLGRDDAGALLAALVERDAQVQVPPALAAQLCDPAVGNPSIITTLAERLIAEALDEGAIDVARAHAIEVPLAAEDAAQARIATLAPDERELLEKGAVLGSVFWSGAVVCLCRLDRGDEAGRLLDDEIRAEVERKLDELVIRDHLLRMPDSTIPGTVEYVFKHNPERALLARAADPERARRAARFAAQWLEARLPARTEEQLEFLAGLHEAGGEPGRAALAWIAAGDSARARHAHAQARELYARGLALLDPDDAMVRIDALHSLGVVTAVTGATREALGCFEEMLRAAWLLDLPAKAGAAHGRIARTFRTLGELEKARLHLEQALHLFDLAGDQRGEAGVEDDLGRLAYLCGDWALAADHHARALEVRQQLEDRRGIALTIHNLALVADASGDAAEAVTRFEEALALRRLGGDRAGVAQTLMELGALWQRRGESGRALQLFEEALGHAREAGDRPIEAQILVRMGEALAGAWRNDEAADLLRQAAELAEEMGDRMAQAEAARLLGEALAEHGRRAESLAELRRAVELSDLVGSPMLRAFAYRGFARLLGQGPPPERADADPHFRTAVELFGEIGADPELARTYRDYGDYLAAGGDTDGAATVYERAEEVARRLAEGSVPTVPIDVGASR